MSNVVVVTGASSGLGKVTAAYLAQKGYTVAGTSRTPKRYDPPQGYTLYPLDLNKPESIPACLDAIVKDHGRIDVLINNAGQGITGAVEELDLTALRSHFDTNFFGPLAVMQAVMPLMRKQKAGWIINITSIAGSMGLPFRGGYSASKGAFQLLTEAARMEAKSHGVRLVTLAPGDYATDIASRRYHEPLKDDSPYYTPYKFSLDTMNAHVDQGNNPLEVAQAIHAILQSSRPKVHYRVGPFLQKFSIFLKKLLPDTLFERLLQNHYKL